MGKLDRFPIERAELRCLFRAMQSYEVTVGDAISLVKMIGSLPDGAEKVAVVRQPFVLIRDAANSISAAAKPVAKLCTTHDVNAEPFARMIDEPCLVDDASHRNAIIASLESLVKRLIASNPAAKSVEMVEQAEPDRPPLGEDAALLYEQYLQWPAYKALTSEKILEWFAQKGATYPRISGIRALYRRLNGGACRTNPEPATTFRSRHAQRKSRKHSDTPAKA